MCINNGSCASAQFVPTGERLNIPIHTCSVPPALFVKHDEAVFQFPKLTWHYLLQHVPKLGVISQFLLNPVHVICPKHPSIQNTLLYCVSNPHCQAPDNYPLLAHLSYCQILFFLQTDRALHHFITVCGCHQTCSILNLH